MVERTCLANQNKGSVIMATIYFSARLSRLNQKTDAIMTPWGAFAPVITLKAL